MLDFFVYALLIYFSMLCTKGAGVCLVKEMNSEVGFVWKGNMFRVDEEDEQWVGVGVCFPVGRNEEEGEKG